MRIELRDYQNVALEKVLENLTKARDRWKGNKPERNAFSLSATTGSGKTVIAAAAFEALFFGNEDYGFEADKGAVVIWFSDSPSLNEQSCYRLKQSSDKLDESHLKIIDNSFHAEKFQPKTIYFLNTQKLSKTSLLTKSKQGRQFTIWETIGNTISDKNLTLYMLLDEAHRGMSNGQDTDRPTIVKQLINGYNATAGPIPIVWGISATVQRFNQAMEVMEERAMLPANKIEPTDVQLSGLIKDKIILDVPTEKGPVDDILLRMGAERLKEKTEAWAEYLQEQGSDDEVLPLMVLQVPNKPDRNWIGRALQSIFDIYPTLPKDSIVNVFGEHTAEEFGPYLIPHQSPERIEEDTYIRVVIAKDAISTGWDCPRAEVMVSFRPARDQTHITQLLGRLLRTPLARRIEGNELLNAVDCFLPHFDTKTVNRVVEYLTTGGNGVMDAFRYEVVVAPETVFPNPKVNERVFDKFLSLPSFALPRLDKNPIARLHLLSRELSSDELQVGSAKRAEELMNKVIDSLRVKYDLEIKEKLGHILNVKFETRSVNLGGESDIESYVKRADRAVITANYNLSTRQITSSLAGSYVKHIRSKAASDPEAEFLKARTEVAAIGQIEELVKDLKQEADKLSEQWLLEFRDDIGHLSDERKDVFESIKLMSTKPQLIDLRRPKVWTKPSSKSGEPVERYSLHLLCGGDGQFPEHDLNEWERHALNKELERDSTIAWYRNPKTGRKDSLGVNYTEDGVDKILRPDFIIFSGNGTGEVKASIINPHNHQLGDALPKIRGLAKYAEVYGDQFHRIEEISKFSDDYKFLDLQDANVRKKAFEVSSMHELYQSFGKDYL